MIPSPERVTIFPASIPHNAIPSRFELGLTTPLLQKFHPIGIFYDPGGVANW